MVARSIGEGRASERAERSENGVSGAERVSGAGRIDGERCTRQCGRVADVSRARGRGRHLHQVSRTGVHQKAAGGGQRTGRGRQARRQRATGIDGDVGNVPSARERAAGVHGCGARDAAGHRKGAAVDRGCARVGVGAGERQRSRPGFGQYARAGNVGGERQRVREVCNDAAIVNDCWGDDGTGEAADAEIERAARPDARKAGRIDHASVCNRECSGRAGAGMAEGERIGDVQGRPGAGHGDERAAIGLIADMQERAGGVDGAAVGNRESSGSPESAVADRHLAAHVPRRAGAGHRHARRAQNSKGIDFGGALTVEHAPTGNC
jgi:hypothetical protein